MVWFHLQKQRRQLWIFPIWCLVCSDVERGWDGARWGEMPKYAFVDSRSVVISPWSTAPAIRHLWSPFFSAFALFSFSILLLSRRVCSSFICVVPRRWSWEIKNTNKFIYETFSQHCSPREVLFKLPSPSSYPLIAEFVMTAYTYPTCNTSNQFFMYICEQGGQWFFFVWCILCCWPSLVFPSPNAPPPEVSFVP